MKKSDLNKYLIGWVNRFSFKYSSESFESVLIRIIKERFGITISERTASCFNSIQQAILYYNSQPKEVIEQLKKED